MFHVMSTKAEGSITDIKHTWAYTDIHPLSIFTFLHSYFLTSLYAFYNQAQSYRASGLSGCHELHFHLLFKLMIERGEEQ